MHYHADDTDVWICDGKLEGSVVEKKGTPAARSSIIRFYYLSRA